MVHKGVLTFTIYFLLCNICLEFVLQEQIWTSNPFYTIPFQLNLFKLVCNLNSNEFFTRVIIFSYLSGRTQNLCMLITFMT